MSAHNILQEMHEADFVLQDPGSGKVISPTKWRCHIEIVTGASGETNTVAAPTKAGQELIFFMKTDGGGDRVITFPSACNTSGNTICTVNDQWDFATFRAANIGGTLRWVMMANSGCTFS